MSDNPETIPTLPLDPEEARRAAIAHHMEALEELALPGARDDGWTPYARRLFLQVLSNSGRVRRACEYCQLTTQSAYALRHRDPIFAAGWDAACALARAPLADLLYEQAVDGVTDTLTRDDGRTVTRHRHDTRLSIAVLHRLDKRCDRAENLGSAHLAAAAHWDQWLSATGAGRDDDLREILEIAPIETLPHRQPCQPDGDPYEGEIDPSEGHTDFPRVWFDEQEKIWQTDFPPPPGFTGEEWHRYGQIDYHRDLTPEEEAVAVADHEAELAEQRAIEEAERKAYFFGVADEEPQDIPSPYPLPSPGGEATRSGEGEGLSAQPSPT